MGTQPQLHALLPGVVVRECQVHAHVVHQPGEPIQVHVTRYGFENHAAMWDGRGRLQQLFDDLHLQTLAIEPLDRLQETPRLGIAETIVSPAGDLPPLLMLDRLCRRRPAARVIAVVTDSRTAVAWIRARADILKPDSGYTVTMTCEEPGPVELYASALYGWVTWWYSTVLELRGGGTEGGASPVSMRELPPPPAELDIVEAWRSYRIQIADIHWETRHPIPDPPKPFGPDILE
ncbi:hypothetical protein [Streptomyces sp. NPDC051704]|uniref:hypothetical protein n=1 Tax=Streptomyces sp. NPDC051704 TaxID=3365671 RepID=UPI00378B1ACF